MGTQAHALLAAAASTCRAIILLTRYEMPPGHRLIRYICSYITGEQMRFVPLVEKRHVPWSTCDTTDATAQRLGMWEAAASTAPLEPRHFTGVNRRGGLVLGD